MSNARSEVSGATLTVRNIGGINETTIEFDPGVTVLAGRNATNRTSLLRAVAAALGSSSTPLKSDAEDGEASLTIDGQTYTRTFERVGGTVTSDGDPYLDDAEAADLFAFLLSSNEARRAVVRGDDLRELIMRPVDTEALQAEIDRLRGEKRRIDRRLDELDELSDELPELETERKSLDERLEQKREALAEAEADLEAADVEPATGREDKAELESKMNDLNEARSELETVEYRLETDRQSLDSLREDREELEEELANLPAVSTERIERLDGEIDRLQSQKRSIESTVNQLNQIVQFNEGMLDGNDPGLGRELSSDGSVTDGLLGEDRTVVCWTCGSEVERSAIDTTLDRLRDLRTDRIEERNKIESELAELRTELDDLRSRRDRHQRVQTKIDRVETEIEDRKSAIEDRIDRREQLQSRIEELEAAVDALQQRDYDEVLDHQRRVSERSFEVERVENQLDSVETKIEEIEAKLAERDSLEDERDRVREDLDERRDRIGTIETEAVEAFNQHMDNLLSVLGYANVERIWIERTERPGRGSDGQFDLHVVRSTDSGAAYEDTVDHLSESEREVTGLVFALAGYLAHEVYETVPFMLLDSLEAIDAERIADLVEYFGTHAEYLVVALLPEDATAVDADYRVTSF
jgi:DNA repair exonuclease SbcCD ATPase subunit